MSDLTQAMTEYADAIRGDWTYFDGRTEKSIILSWVEEMAEPQGITIEQWRERLGLCPNGKGHWPEHCEYYCDGEDEDE